MKYLPYLSLAVLLWTPLTGHAQANDYTIIQEDSSVTFTGTHAGNDFEGRFEDWQADVTFDPDNLNDSKITARFNLESAKTGDAMYDGTLPKADWFDVENHPEGTFESTGISARSDGTYIADGTLTLRGISNPISVPFTLSDLSQSPVTARSEFTVDRLAYDIGKKSDPEAEWVSRKITVRINLTARKGDQTAN